MFSFAPVAVHTPYHFEVTENGRGYWIAKDKEGLVGGVFRTQKDALRFALFEAAGDSACVQLSSSSKPRSADPDPITSSGSAVKQVQDGKDGQRARRPGAGAH